MNNGNSIGGAWARAAAITATAVIAASVLSGCARDGSDRMDTAFLRGAQKSKKAVEHKAGAQRRVDDATSILDGK